MSEEERKNGDDMGIKIEAGKRLPACVQDCRNKQVLRIGYVDGETIAMMEADAKVALLNIETGKSEKVLAGEHFEEMEVDSVNLSADEESVLIGAKPKGSTTGANQFLGSKSESDILFLSELQDFIDKRREELPEKSYTTKLFKGGVKKMSKKVGEECIEAIVEAVNGDRNQFVYECSDMIYHLIVLLSSKGLRIEDLARELKARH